jgi:hypothetical protein
VCGAATDNYKASFNDDPDAPELRTWLALHELELDGVRYAPPASDTLLHETLTLQSAESPSDTIEVSVRIVSGPGSTLQLRTGPQRELWGPLLQLSSRDALQSTPVLIELSTGDDSQPLRLEYRYDESLAQAPESSLEHNGPGGRWYVGGTATATNLELGWE